MRSSPPILPFLGDTARGFCGGFPEAEPRGIKAMVIATAMPIGDIRMELPRLPRRLCPRSSSLPASCSWMFLRPRQRAADLLIGRPRNETSIAPTLCQADASSAGAGRLGRKRTDSCPEAKLPCEKRKGPNIRRQRPTWVVHEPLLDCALRQVIVRAGWAWRCPHSVRPSRSRFGKLRREAAVR
jgi:hypothetical protein